MNSPLVELIYVLSDKGKALPCCLKLFLKPRQGQIARVRLTVHRSAFYLRRRSSYHGSPRLGPEIPKAKARGVASFMGSYLGLQIRLRIADGWDATLR